VIWRLSRSISKSRLFRKSNGNDIAIFWSKCDSIQIPYHPRGTGDWCRRSQNGFLHPRESDHAECRGVHIFNSKYWGGNRNRILCKKWNLNWIERKKPQLSHDYLLCVNSGIAICSIICAMPVGCIVHRHS